MNLSVTETSSNSTNNESIFFGYLQMYIFGVYFLISFPTHSFVIWLMVTGSVDFFNLNQSVCEIGNALNCLFYIVGFFFPSCLQLPQFFLGMFFFGRPLFQCLMCVERYLAVVHPVTFLKYKPLRYRLVCSTLAWTFILCMCVSFVFVDFEKIGPVTTQFFLLQFLLAFSIQLFCLVTVLQALKQSGPGDIKKDERNNMKRKAFQLILISTVGMSIIYLPFTVGGLYTILSGHYKPLFWFVGMFCYMFAGFVQPVLYLHQSGKLSCSLCKIRF